MKANRFNFRAWHPKNKTMVTFYFEDLHDDANCMRHFGLLASDKHPAGKGLLMQSTGLTDKNGVEIFEGDVVKTRICFGPAGSEERNIEVKYSALGEISIQLWVYNEKKCHWPEIIGNIYEDSHLKETK